MQAVLAHSLPLKQAKAGLRSLKSWGKVTARNGKVLVAFVLLIRFLSMLRPPLANFSCVPETSCTLQLMSAYKNAEYAGLSHRPGCW